MVVLMCTVAKRFCYFVFLMTTFTFYLALPSALSRCRLATGSERIQPINKPSAGGGD